MALSLRVGPAEDERTDDDLVAALRHGEDEAFEALFERYRRRIASFVYGMVGDWARAEDITQEVFISALRRMRETERSIAFKPWVHEIAKNATIDHFRRARRAQEVSIDADGALAPADEARLAEKAHTPEAALERREQVNDLLGAFGGLSESHHDILVLRELEGLSYHEIGEQMGLSRPSVESTLFRARRRLTEEYDDLRSGRRCEGVRETITAAALRPVGLRERRRMRRHLAHCLSCRRHARHAGLASRDDERGAGVGAKVAALLPFPLLGRRGRAGAAGGDTAAHLPSLTRLTVNVAPAFEPLAGGWPRAAAAALTVAAAGAGAGLATRAAETSIPRHPAPVLSAPARSVPVAQRASASAKPVAPSAVHRLRLAESLRAPREVAVGIEKLAATSTPSPRVAAPAIGRSAAPRATPDSRPVPGPRVAMPSASSRPDVRLRATIPRFADAGSVKARVQLPGRGQQAEEALRIAADQEEKVLGPAALPLGEIPEINPGANAAAESARRPLTSGSAVRY